MNTKMTHLSTWSGSGQKHKEGSSTVGSLPAGGCVGGGMWRWLHGRGIGAGDAAVSPGDAPQKAWSRFAP